METTLENRQPTSHHRLHTGSEMLATDGRAPESLAQQPLKELIASFELPPCPPVVAQAMLEAQHDETQTGKLADLVAANPELSAAVLQIANLVLGRTGGSTTDVHLAAYRLGSENMRCIVLAEALRASVKGPLTTWRKQFWRRNAQLALCAAAVARRPLCISPDAAYIYTLFRDAAIPLAVTRFKENTLTLQAATTLHPMLGARLARNWGLPAIFPLAIAFHHQPDIYRLTAGTLPEGVLTLIASTQVAEYLVAEVAAMSGLEIGIKRFDQARDHLGISVYELDELRARIEFTLTS